MKRFLLYISIFSAIAIGLWSCVNDPYENRWPQGERLPLAIEMGLKGEAYAPASRAVRSDSADMWSYVGFTDGDKMGFYASGGNWMEGNYANPFVNTELTYQTDEGTKKGQFRGPTNSTFEPSGMNSNEIFMYFPYSPTVATTGMPLRTPNDGIQKCTDLLSSTFLVLQGVQNGAEMSLYGEFTHSFSELIIMRGEGFDDPPAGKTDITAVINNGITNFKLTYDPEAENWECVPSLVFDSSSGLTQDQARRWEAWEGGRFGITDIDPEGKRAWYVIIPTLPNQLTTVDYVELCDNDGYYQTVTSLKLKDGNTKLVEPGWRYPMEITMKELVPTVNPFRIIPWGNNIDLTDQRTRGINDEAEFALWVRDYNLYLKDPENEDYITQLLNYGDRTTTEGSQESSWHFYILSNLNLSNYLPLPPEDGSDTSDPYDYSIIINKLASGDILDGISTAIAGGKFMTFSITGLNKTFIGTLNGRIQNLEFIEPEIIYESETPAGIIATTIEGGNVVNCTIDNGTLFNPNGPGGMISGSMNSGGVYNCNISGTLYSSSTSTSDFANKLIGEDPTGTYNFEDNDVDVVP